MATPMWDDGFPSLGFPHSGDYPISLSEPPSSQLDQQSCPICLDHFEDPRLLTCSHSFCRRCLVNVLAQRTVDPENPMQGNGLMCPKCRVVTVLTESGVNALPVNYELMEDVDLFDDDPLGLSMAPLPPDPVSIPARVLSGSPPPPTSLHFCAEHNRLLDFFCCECNLLLCATCAVKQRCGHDIKEASEVVSDLRTQCYDPLEIRYLKTTVAVDEVTRMMEAVRKDGESNKQRIRNMFQDLRNALNSREMSLIQAIEGIMNKKGLALQCQLETLQTLSEELRSTKEMVSRTLDAKGNSFNFLQNHKKLIDEVNQMIAAADLQERNPVENIKEGPECHLPETLLRDANSYGEIYCLPHPGRFVASGVGLEKAFLGIEAEFVVEAHDKYGQRAFKSGSLVAVEVEGPVGSDFISTSVTDMGRGRYAVRYTPNTVGFHSVTITADGKNISNWRSLLAVFNRRDYSGIMQPQCTLTRHQIHPDVSTIRGVCTLRNNQIVFSDAFYLRVISSSGKLVKRAMGCFGEGQGQFNIPAGVAANTQDSIFVADSQNNRVQRLSADGKFQMSYGTSGNKAALLNHPEDVAVSDNRLFVVDSGNHRIQVFQQKNGRLVNTIGGRVLGGTVQLRSPQGIATDEPRKRMFVADSGNNRVLGLSLDGRLLPDFGQNSEVSLSCPTCVAVDRDGFVLVTSSRTGLLTILTPQGTEVKQLGVEGTLFGKPCGICIDASGNVIVADPATASIHIV